MEINAISPLYLTPAELCDRWRGQVTPKTLANWRHRGEGPAYVKTGGKILYPVDGVQRYEAHRTRCAPELR